MKKCLILLTLVFLLAVPVSAMEFTAPQVPESAETLMPDTVDSFGEGLWELVKSAVPILQPAVAEAAKVCLSLIAVVLLISLVDAMPGESKRTTTLAGAITVGMLLLQNTSSLVNLGVDTVQKLSEYGKLLLPVMAAAMAAQGGTTSSAALYTGTALFDTVLSTVIAKLIVPMIYIFLCLAVANSALGEDVLKKLRDFVKWLMTWCLKIVLYVFTGYIGITGVASGTTDAAALKAAKLTISGVIPVVGNILSDASEAVLVSAGVMKSAAGVYGLLAILALWLEPFLRIGVQYLLLKITAAVCGVFGNQQTVSLIQDFSGAMGMLLAMTGTVCLLLLISTVCFMKGVG